MAVYGETGRYPLYINRYVRMVKYWGNVLKTDNIIMKTMYNDMLEKQKNGQKNWASQIKNILDMYGFSYVWNNQKTFDFKKIGYLIKIELLTTFCKNGMQLLLLHPQLLCTNFFKPQLCYESYLDQLSVKNIKLLAKFRLSSCKLNAITGKYKNNDNNKLCKMCDLNDIEDEFHFVLVCPKYLILRQKYIKPYFYKKPSVYKLCQLLSSNRNSLTNLCKFFPKPLFNDIK